MTNFRLFQLKDFADDNFKFDENSTKIIQTGRKHCGKKEKLLITSNFSFSLSVFKRLILPFGHQKVSLCGNGSKKAFEKKAGKGEIAGCFEKHLICHLQMLSIWTMLKC